MGTIRPPQPVKLFTGVLLSNPALLPEVEERLVAAFGPVDRRTELLRFDFTDYYAREMGNAIDRVFFSFERLIEADFLAGVKLRTNAIEEEFGRMPNRVRRPVNIDPGYIEQAKVVLASTKNFYHRVYLGQGIFAEVTMHFRNNGYQFFPWTYPDFKSAGYQAFFTGIRRIYRAQLTIRQKEN